MKLDWAVCGGRRSVLAFSLVEIAIAVGIMSFALVAMLSLASTGIQSNREAIAQVKAANIASTALTIRRKFPEQSGSDSEVERLGLAPISEATPSGGRTVWLDDSGFAVDDGDPEATFRMVSKVIPDAATRSSTVHIRVEWPASAPASHYEIVSEIAWR